MKSHQSSRSQLQLICLSSLSSLSFPILLRLVVLDFVPSKSEGRLDLLSSLKLSQGTTGSPMFSDGRGAVIKIIYHSIKWIETVWIFSLFMKYKTPKRYRKHGGASYTFMLKICTINHVGQICITQRYLKKTHKSVWQTNRTSSALKQKPV